MNLSIKTLAHTIANADGTNDLIFEDGDERYMIRNAKVYLPEDIPTDSEEYEYYWDDAANVDRAVAEAKEVEEIA